MTEETIAENLIRASANFEVMRDRMNALASMLEQCLMGYFERNHIKPNGGEVEAIAEGPSLKCRVVVRYRGSAGTSPEVGITFALAADEHWQCNLFSSGKGATFQRAANLEHIEFVYGHRTLAIQAAHQLHPDVEEKAWEHAFGIAAANVG